MPTPTPEDDRTQKSPPRVKPAPTDQSTRNLESVDAELPQDNLTELIGRFEIRSVLGQGAFGRVYRAFDPDLHREVAIKIPHGEVLSRDFRERFLREARAAATIHHPNVCPVYEVGSEGNLPYIVMRFVPGSTLATVLATRPTGFPPQHAAAIVRKLALGVAAAHAHQVIHRDLKPQNIIWDDATREVFITDFGLARIGGDTQMTADGVVMGTPLYMAPEQMAGDTNRVGPLSDVYALGVILYEHLLGKTPFEGDFWQIMGQKLFRNFPSPAEVRPGLDSRLNNLCMEAMAPEPEKRFPSAKEFAHVLTEYLRGNSANQAVEPTAGEVAGLVFAEEIVDPPAKPRAPVWPLTPPVDPPAKPRPPVKPAPPPSETLKKVIETLPNEIWGEHEQRGRSEVLVCPRCGSRMQVQQGRTKPVPCPRCTCLFSVDAGRAAARPVVAPPPPKPLPVAKPLPSRKPKDESLAKPRPRRRSRVLSCGLLIAILGVLGVVGYANEEELTAWIKSFQPDPVQFAFIREFEPGADEARVYQFISDEPELLLTNANNKDLVAQAWNVTTGEKVFVLGNCPPGSDAALDPKGLLFRFRPGQMGVFSRDPLSRDRGGVWVYALPTDKPEITRPITPTIQEPRKRPWDMNRKQTRAVGAPGTEKVALWNVPKGQPITELVSEGSTLRAVAFSPDGDSVIGLCDQSYLWVWDANTGKREEKNVRLKVRPTWSSNEETADLTFDPSLTHVTVKTDSQVGVWDMKSGAVIVPMKPLAEGALLRVKYRLRVETAGKGTCSVFHDDHTLRAAKLTIPGEGSVTSWCLNEDRTMLAISSKRKVVVWRLTYPGEK